MKIVGKRPISEKLRLIDPEEALRRAAELLGVSRFGLQKMMKRLEIASPV